MKNHLQFHWWKYIALALLPIFLWTGVFRSLAQPKPNQRVNILFIGENLDTAGICRELEEALPTLTDQEILHISVDREHIQKDQLYNTLTVRCFDYDLIILENKYMQKNMGQNIFVRLLPELAEQLPYALPYQETAEDSVLTFGFVLYDGSTENHFSQHYSGTESCYVFVSPESVNFNTLNEKGIPGQDAALRILQYMTENEK